MWCDVPWGLHSPGPTPSPYPRRVSAVVPPSGSSEKVLSAPARAHASPDVHSDRARSGASQAAQGPRTGTVVRRGFRYWYEAPDADSKYPTQTPRCACATHGALNLRVRCPHHAPSKRPPLSQTRGKPHQRVTDFRPHDAATTPSMLARQSAAISPRHRGIHKKRTGRTAYCSTFTPHTFHDMASSMTYTDPIDL